jgi:RNA polymerase sigma factor (sigma-70 family)
MKDYAVQIKVQNNFLLERMRLAGFETVAALARASGVNQSSIGKILNLKAAGQNSRDQWRSHVLKISECLRCLPEDIIPEQHHKETLSKNTASLTMDASQVQNLLLVDNSPDYMADTALNRDEVLRLIELALHTLNPRTERVLRLRFGFGGNAMTPKEIGEVMGVTSTRIQQIESRALQRLATLPKHRQFEDLPNVMRDMGRGK